MWAGPEAATMCNVPPDTGLPALADVEDVDVELHAASPAAASTAAASVTTRCGALIMAIYSFGDGLRRSQGNQWRPDPSDCLTRETVRSRHRNPDHSRSRSLIVTKVPIGQVGSRWTVRLTRCP